jgi:hypothetical protein
MAVKVADTAVVTVVFATVQVVPVEEATPAVMEYPAGKPPVKRPATSEQLATAAVPALVVLILLEA